MDERVKRIIAGETFITEGGYAKVIDRQAAGRDSMDDVLLLKVTESRVGSFVAWTTVNALWAAVENGGWTLPSDDVRLAA